MNEINTIGFLIGGWLLSLFGVDNLFEKAIHELFHKDVSTASYYFMFLIFGLMCDVLSVIRDKQE